MWLSHVCSERRESDKEQNKAFKLLKLFLSLSKERELFKKEKKKINRTELKEEALQQNVFLVTKISEEIFFVTKNTALVTKYEFRH